MLSVKVVGRPSFQNRASFVFGAVLHPTLARIANLYIEALNQRVGWTQE